MTEQGKFWGLVKRVLDRLYFFFAVYRKLDSQTKLEWKKLGAGSVLVDLGANIGLITAAARRRGSTVYSIEPNPWAREELDRRFEGDDEVIVHSFAASTLEGQADLFLHEDHLENPKKYSTGSSLVSSKPNVTEHSQSVVTRDFASFLNGLPRVDFLKIDIEGFEVELVPHLVQEVDWRKVSFVAVETHSGAKWPGLGSDTEQMKESVRGAGLSAKFSWSWP